MLACNFLAVVLVPEKVHLSSHVFQPHGLCSGGTSPCIYEERHPEMSFTDRAGVSTFYFLYEYCAQGYNKTEEELKKCFSLIVTVCPTTVWE